MTNVVLLSIYYYYIINISLNFIDDGYLVKVHCIDLCWYQCIHCCCRACILVDDGYLVKVQCIDSVDISASFSLDKPSYCGSKDPQIH